LVVSCSNAEVIKVDKGTLKNKENSVDLYSDSVFTITKTIHEKCDSTIIKIKYKNILIDEFLDWNCDCDFSFFILYTNDTLHIIEKPYFFINNKLIISLFKESNGLLSIYDFDGKDSKHLKTLSFFELPIIDFVNKNLYILNESIRSVNYEKNKIIKIPMVEGSTLLMHTEEFDEEAERYFEGNNHEAFRSNVVEFISW
jgi:hypothetical protein